MTQNTESFNSGMNAPVPQETGSAYLDRDIAILLSRLAAIQGHAVPAHRFGMMSNTLAGEVDQLERHLGAVERWMTAVPGGDAQVLSGEASRNDLPALWVSASGDEARILRGALSRGGYACENADGTGSELTPAQARGGKFVVLRPELNTQSGTGPADKPKSARDWFTLALRKQRGVFIEAVVATFVISVLALVSGFFTMQVYDRVVPTQGYSTLLVLTVGALLAITLELVLKQVRASMVDRASKDIDQELSGVFFGQVLNIRMDARPKTVGTFAGQVRQFELVRNFMTSSTLFLLADAPFVLFFIMVIAWVGGVIALIPIALLPLALLAGMYAQWRIKGLAEDQLNEINQKNGVLIEAIDGIEAVKAVGGEWKLLDRWQNLTAEAATRELRIRATTMMANNLGQTLQQASYVLLIATGAYAINSGQLTMGGLIACAIISNRALTPIAQISGLFVQWQHAKAALKGLDHMMSLPTDRDGNTRMVIPESCRGEIRLEEASFSYEESRVALQATNLHIQPGERIAIIGPVGAGKSTLIKILTGMYRPSEGRAFMDGVDMAHIAPEFLRENIGYLTQDVRLFNGTLRDNLTLGLPSPTDGQILSAARKTGLERLITAHPLGLELPIAEGGRGLSGGQRQLVGLTRLLLANPRILLLDEPTASMDSELESFVMMNLFRATPPDTVIVLATHKRGLLKLVDRIIIVDQNRIVHDGRRDDVLRLMMAARKKQMGQAPSPSPGQVTEEEL